jgi:hypothetical protein
MRKALVSAERSLERVESDLAGAGAFPSMTLDLCLACLKIDWNRNGRVDRRDMLLLQIERDENGRRMPKDDPRRRPTFRFDHGDLYWARAFVAFQRTALNLVLAYKWTEVSNLLRMGMREMSTITIRLHDRGKVVRARGLLLHGLKMAGAARKAYLAETDDHREWLPNPRQKDHPMPLPVDGALYETWAGVLGDLTGLLHRKAGLSVAELAQLGDHKWKNPPQGFVDIGGMFDNPKDIVFDLRVLKEFRWNRRRHGEDEDRKHTERLLRSLLGAHYVPQMKPTPLIKRLRRMKSEVERGSESLARKLRYLLWVN